MESRNCLNCDMVFIASGYAWNRKYCNHECAKEHRGYRGAYEGVSNNNVGAIAELEVCSDLLKMGFNVFRSVSQNALCDMIITKRGSPMLRVEVKSAYRNKNGAINYPRPKEEDHDILALYLHSERIIIYKPELK